MHRYPWGHADTATHFYLRNAYAFMGFVPNGQGTYDTMDWYDDGFGNVVFTRVASPSSLDPTLPFATFAKRRFGHGPIVY